MKLIALTKPEPLALLPAHSLTWSDSQKIKLTEMSKELKTKKNE